MSKTGCIISHEGIEYLCGLIRDINGLDTKLIDDLNIKSNGTFSSVRIDSLLNALKTDCNDFASSLVANLSRLELKVVTDEADMIEHNKLYLIKKAGETSYSQYVIVTNDSGVDEKILLGTCDISMTDYLKITDADSTYCKKTDFDTLKTALTTHTSDTTVHITSDERTKWNEVDNKVNTTDFDTLKTKVDNKVDKTDIVSVLDSTVTNKQLIDGKTLVDKFNSIEDNLSRRYNFDDKKSASIVDRKLAIKAVINSLKKDGATDSSIDYYGNNLVFLIRYNGGYYYSYIMTSYMSKVFIQEYSPYATDVNFWLEDEMGELYIRGTIPMVKDIIRIVNPFTANKDKYKLYDGKYTIDEKTNTCTLTVSIDCLSPAAVSTDVGSLNTLNFKPPSSPATFDLQSEKDSTSTIKFYLGVSVCQIWDGTAGKRYTGTITYRIK